MMTLSDEQFPCLISSVKLSPPPVASLFTEQCKFVIKSSKGQDSQWYSYVTHGSQGLKWELENCRWNLVLSK